MKAVAIVILVNFVLMFVTGLTYPVMPLYLGRLENVGVIAAGLTLLISSLIVMLSNIVFGYLPDVFGGRKLFISIGLDIVRDAMLPQHSLKTYLYRLFSTPWLV